MKFQGKIMFGNGNMVANIDNKSYHVSRDHTMYAKLFEAYKNDDADSFVGLFDITDNVSNYCNTEGLVVHTDGRVVYNGVELNNAVVDTIRNMMKNDLNFDFMVKFLRRTIDSNSSRVINELFKFIESCGLTITEDGCFLAYKTVDSDYLDKYIHRINNRVGADIPRMPKWKVNDDCTQVCSHGYHVGGLEYAGPGGWYNNSNDHVMICKVAPEDVVSVPVDHSFQKLRCCHYEVVGEFKQELKQTVYSGKVGDDYCQPDEVDDDDCELELGVEDMVVDGMYQAMYTSMKEGFPKLRYFVVLDKTPKYAVVELLEPEEKAGDIRRFNLANLYDVEAYDEIDWLEKVSVEDKDEDEDTDGRSALDSVYW